MVEIVGIDADDTLWDEASLFAYAEASFVTFVQPWLVGVNAQDLLRTLHFSLLSEVGYGVRGYHHALKLFCESALPVSVRPIAIKKANAVISAIKNADFAPFIGIESNLRRLRSRFSLQLITKGDEEFQRTKIERSGLASYFDGIHIIPSKDSAQYNRIFADRPAAMIGNSIKSDIIPALEAGAIAIHVPHRITSPLESAPIPLGAAKFVACENFSHASDWLLKENWRLLADQ